jgi:hypothetical protein
MMTTDASRTRFIAWAVLAPTTACALGLAADWAVKHDPRANTTPGTEIGGGQSDQRLAELRSKVQQARSDFTSVRHRVVNVERRVQQRSQQVAALIQQNALTPAPEPAVVPSSPIPAAPVPAAPAPAPAPPPTDTTTGSS